MSLTFSNLEHPTTLSYEYRQPAHAIPIRGLGGTQIDDKFRQTF